MKPFLKTFPHEVNPMNVSTVERTQKNSQSMRIERNSRRLWVSLIVGFFALDFTIAAIAITMAAGDPSFRSIPGYGERAVAWDVRQQRKQASKDLGWQLTIKRSEPLHDSIELTILDSNQQPVSGCTGTFRLFHFTRVAEQHHGEWTEVDAGHYRASVDVNRPGLWQMELDIRGTEGQAFWSEQSLSWMQTEAFSEMCQKKL